MKTDGNGIQNCGRLLSTTIIQHNANSALNAVLIVDGSQAGSIIGFSEQHYPASSSLACSTLNTRNENYLKDMFSISPNPALEKISISSPFAVVATNIYNSLGSLMITSKNETDITISSLPAGIYFLRVQTVDSVFAKKFIKE
jgi:hypothetical protein